MSAVPILTVRQPVDGHDRHDCRNQHLFHLSEYLQVSTCMYIHVLAQHRVKAYIIIILAILCSEAGWTGSGSGLDELISSNCINLHIIIANTWLQLL